MERQKMIADNNINNEINSFNNLLKVGHSSATCY